MNNNLQVFNSKELGLKMRVMKNEDGSISVNAEDVAIGFGWTQEKNGKGYVRWESINGFMKDLGFSHQVGKDDFIPESLFYMLGMKANNKVAQEFQKWLAVDVIPSIRKNGAYMTDNTIEKVLTDPDFLIKLATQLKEEKSKRIEAEERNKLNQPKVLFAESVAASNSSILVGDLAKLLKQNGIDTGAKRLFGWLREKGYLIKRKGTDYNMPTQKSMDLEVFEIKETAITHSDGHITVNKTPKVTGKGQLYFIDKFIGGEKNEKKMEERRNRIS